MEAYCLKCKTKRELIDPQPVYFANGTAATRGTCAVCGSVLNRMGRTPAHEGLAKPEPRPKPAEPRRKRGNGTGASAGGNGHRAGKLVIVESPAGQDDRAILEGATPWPRWATCVTCHAAPRDVANRPLR
jgi:DNA topoisomerase-1